MSYIKKYYLEIEGLVKSGLSVVDACKKIKSKYKTEKSVNGLRIAYKVYKELERQLKEKESYLSPEKAIDIAKTIYQVIARSDNNQPVKHILILTDEQKYLSALFEFG